jgi:hypothetical protein
MQAQKEKSNLSQFGRFIKDLQRPLIDFYDNALTLRLRHELKTDGKIDWPSVKALIVQGADPNATQENDSMFPCGAMTALMLAAVGNSRDICRFLVQHGANVNATNTYQETPLMLAAMNDSKAICALLVMNGADASIVRRSSLSSRYGIANYSTAMDLGSTSTQNYMKQLVSAKAWLDGLLGEIQHDFYPAFRECVQ